MGWAAAALPVLGTKNLDAKNLDAISSDATSLEPQLGDGRTSGAPKRSVDWPAKRGTGGGCGEELSHEVAGRVGT